MQSPNYRRPMGFLLRRRGKAQVLLRISGGNRLPIGGMPATRKSGFHGMFSQDYYCNRGRKNYDITKK